MRGSGLLKCCSLAIFAWACGGEAPEVSGNIQVEPLPEIGGDVQESASTFGQVGDVELDGHGNVYVLDRMAGFIQVFDVDGVYARTIGRRGEGPGELEMPTAIGWGPEGNLWVVDARNARYTVFDTTGSVVSTYSRPLEGIVGDWPVTFTRDGRLYDVGVDLAPEGPSPVPVELEIGGDQVQETRRVQLPPLGPWGLNGRPMERDGRLILVEIPFSPVQVWQIGPDGDLWYANTGVYEIRRRSLDGKETLFTGNVVGPAVTDSQRQAALEENQLLDISMIPSTRPPVRGFFEGDEGELWVLLNSDSEGEADRVDVLNSVGRRVATLNLALDPRPRPKIRDGILIGVATDELGVQRVVRYRIVRG